MFAVTMGSGRIWSIGRDGTAQELTNIRLGGNDIVDFHLDPATKDIFVLEHGSSGRVMRITEQGGGQPPSNYPLTLSETGIFADLATLTPNPGVVPYTPNLTFWSDGADKKRWFVIKDLSDHIEYSQDTPWAFPTGMIWVKHFDYDLDQTNPGTQVKRLETRLLVKNSTGAYGVSYRWNASGTEATLVDPTGDSFAINFTNPSGIAQNLNWEIPSRASCMTCHNPTAGTGLSTNTRQLNLHLSLAGQPGNFLNLLSTAGYLNGFTNNPSDLPKHYHPNDDSADLEARFRSYVDVNCAYCHQTGGGAPDSWDARAHLFLSHTNILYGRPVSESSPDLTDHLVRPGDLMNSAIWNRINARTAINGHFNGYSQMPPIASNRLDHEGIELVRRWIENHANVAPTVNSGSLDSVTVTENTLPGTSLGNISATDPDIRDSVTDQSRLVYSIVGGNSQSLFSINPLTGEITVNGLLDFESSTQHNLQVAIEDRFDSNPGISFSNVTVNLTDVTIEDANGNGLPDWWESNFSVTGLTLDGDNDNDGLREFFEFVGGSNPEDSNSRQSLSIVPSQDSGSPSLFQWRHRNGLIIGKDYSIQKSTDLSVWQDLSPNDYSLVSDTPDGIGFSRITIELNQINTRCFVRLSSAPGFQSLFNGANLMGWTQLEGTPGIYSVVPPDGDEPAFIQGTADGARGMLATAVNTYHDFELLYDFKVDDLLNSGVQIRSFLNGSNEVQGYQIEIDPSSRSWTGGLYEQRGRGWLYDLSANEPARNAFLSGGWNRVRVLVKGNRVRSWVNGVLATDYTETAIGTPTSGFIALQVHQGDSSIVGKTVGFRNIFLREL